MMKRRRLSVESLEARFVPSTFNLHQGDNLQQTIHTAVPGDVILLDAGATFTGPVTLEAKTNPSKQSITIATNLFPVSAGVRVGPNDASSMAQILAPGLNQPAVQTQAGANYYTLRGLNILPVNASAVVDTLVTIGDGSSNQTATTALPNNIILDQCFIHGLDGQPIKRGVGLNDGGIGSKTGVYNSYVSNFKLQGQDSQAIAGWNGTGPYTIQNNYLEGAGETILFGGAFSYIQQVPSNILISNNLISKQLSWNPKDPSYGNVLYTVKNLLELKNAKNVTIDSNTIQNNWAGAQDGHAILLTPRGDQSGGSWVTVGNVTLTHNLVQNSDQGITLLGSDDSSASQVVSNVLFQDNVFNNIKSGQIFTILPGRNGGTRNVAIDHNTITAAYTDVLVSSVHTGFQFTNNVMPQGTYGMFVDGQGQGPGPLARAFPGGVITGNVIVGGSALNYPPGNFFPATWPGVAQFPAAGARNMIIGSATTTAVSSSANPSALGQSVTFTATVSSSVVGTPTGTVSFFDGSTNLGQGTVGTVNGVTTATLSTSSLTVGAHTIIATYSGDSSFASSSATVPAGQVVNPVSTSAMVSSSANPSGLQQMVTFTTTINPQNSGIGTPTGTVLYRIDGQVVGSPVKVTTSNGTTTATLSTSNLSFGTHTVTASYSGDASFANSSGTLAGGQAVNLSSSTPTTTSVSSSANPSLSGQAVTFTATVMGNGGLGSPTGTVTFFDGSRSIGQGNLLGSGSAATVSFTTSSLAVASHSITASYSGDSFFQSSKGTLTQTVNKAGSNSSAATRTTVSSSANPSVLGQSVTFTATVSGPGTPTGTVSFFDGSVSIGFGTVSSANGVTTASFSTSSLAAGAHPISATYSGDGSFASSFGTLAGDQVVNNPTAAGNNVTATPNPSTGVLSITGNSGNDAITITQVSPGVIQVAGTGTTVNESSNPAKFSSITGISISLMNGNNSVTMNSLSVSGNITISAGSGSDTFSLATVGANSISISATGPDTVSVSNVTARGDLNITVGAGTTAVAVTGTTCLDLTIRAKSAASDTIHFDLENDTVTAARSGGLTLDDSQGAGNDTVTLSHVKVAFELMVTLSSGTNTVNADFVTALFGSINGGSNLNSHYFDNGSNSGYFVSGFAAP